MAVRNLYARPRPSGDGLPESAFAEVFRSNDPIQLQTIADLLDSHGLDVRSSGQLSGAAVGVGQHLVANLLRVPADESDKAQQVIQDFLASTPVVDEDEEENEAPAPERRRLIVAGLVPFVIPIIAGGLFYARQTVAAAILSVAECLAFVSFHGMGVYAVLKVAEVILALQAAQAWNRGERPTALRQAATVAVAIVVALAIGVALGGATPFLRLRPHHG